MEPYQRYLRLKETIASLETDSRSRSYGWYKTHNAYLQEYYDAFEDFETVHPDIDSNEFRSNCRDLNILLYKLMKDYRDRQWFGLYEYLQFNKILLKTVEYVFAYRNSDDLCSMLSVINLSGEPNKGRTNTEAGTCAS